MSDDDNYIDVMTSTRVARRIDCYRATIEINVWTRKGRSCMQLSLAIRDRVLAALTSAGLATADIEEGAGTLARPSWTTSTQFSQTLVIRHSHIPTLMQAMANMEQVFASFDEGWFSGIRRNYSFGTPAPEYRDDPLAAEAALKEATLNARLKAEHLAAGVQCRVEEVVSIVEIIPAPSVSKIQSPTFTESSIDFDVVDGLAASVPRSVSYTTAATPQGLAARCFRVRFRIAAVAPQGASTSPE